jgi:ElaB/YqjD/DUF883 family membrane-anchored ribosome-binding protein
MDTAGLETKLGGKVEQLNGLLNKGQQYATQLGAQAQAQLRERPLVAVLGAVALGFIAGALLARRSGR